MTKTKLGKPKARPRFLEALASTLKKGWGVPCVKHIKDLDFNCIVCRLTLALHILENAYEVGWRKVRKV